MVLVFFPLPGILNQGEEVGNIKGLVVIVIQNGGVLPCGTPHFAVGMAAPLTASLLSGKALFGALGAAQIKNEGLHFHCVHVDSQVYKIHGG